MLTTTILRLTPPALKRTARKALRAATNTWIRGRARALGVPASAAAYDAFTLRLAAEFECRVPIAAKLGNGLAMHVVWSDHVSNHILAAGYYERETVAVLERFLRPGMTFLDIGGHIGQYSLVASPLVGPTGQVHSFEPDPETFAWLRDNCRRNGLTNVRLNQVGLADRASVQTLYFSYRHDIGSNSLAQPKHFSGRSVDVTCLRLDDYVRSHGIGRVHLCKMDVEGAELAVLRGGERLFSGPQRPVLILEFEEERQRAFGASCRDLASWLGQRGYKLYTIGERSEPYTPGPDDPPSLNILALPEGVQL
jgi:FkbM family methyltransferase